MFKNLFKNKFAINKITDPIFPLKKPFSPIITTSDKIIQIFKSLRVARIVLCLMKKVSSEYFTKRERYNRLSSQGNLTNGSFLIRASKF